MSQIIRGKLLVHVGSYLVVGALLLLPQHLRGSVLCDGYVPELADSPLATVVANAHRYIKGTLFNRVIVMRVVTASEIVLFPFHSLFN